MRARTGFAIFVAMLTPACRPQQPPTPQYAQPTEMLAERVEESYAIYSQLLVSGPVEWREAKRKQWLIEEVTTAVPVDSVCHPSGPGPAMDPHNAVRAPENSKSEWLELLVDYDAHCHDVLRLHADKFHVDLPVHLLALVRKQEFGSATSPRNTTGTMPEEFKDAAGLQRFSAVFFNQAHTLALVEQGIYCPGLCGNWTWIVLEKRDGHWNILPWVRSSMIV